MALGFSLVAGSIRLASVARGDMELAVTLLKASGYVSPLVNIALTLLPTLLMYGCVYALQYRWAALEAGQSDFLSGYAWIIVIYAFSAISWIGAWHTLAIGVALIAIIGATDRFFRRSARKTGTPVTPSQYMRHRRSQILGGALPAVWVILFLQIANPDPWVPEEAIITDSEVIRGYVIDVGDPWVAVLVDDPRHLRYVPASDIEEREVCPEAESPSVVNWLMGRTGKGQAPECSEAKPPEE